MFGLDKGTVTRTALLILALVNTSLQLLGWDVLPFGEQDLEMAITVIFNIVAGGLAWWKNQPITKEAKEAQKVLQDLKAQSK